MQCGTCGNANCESSAMQCNVSQGSALHQLSSVALIHCRGGLLCSSTDLHCREWAQRGRAVCSASAAKVQCGISALSQCKSSAIARREAHLLALHQLSSSVALAHCRGGKINQLPTPGRERTTLQSLRPACPDSFLNKYLSQIF